MGQVFLAVLHISLAGAIFVVAVIVLRFLLNKLLPTVPRTFHCALWALVALRLLLPVSVESPFSLIPEDVAQGEVLTEWRDVYVGTTMMIFDQMEGYDAAVEAGREQYYAGEPGHYYVVTGEDGISPPPTVESERFPVYGWIWLAGCAVMVGYAAVSYLRVHRRVRLSLHLRDNIWRCEAVDSPFILGFFRPKIYLPYSMDERQMQYVTAHEEAHLRRRDHWWKPLGFLLLALHWFNPLLWVAYILLCRDIELACDERVIRQMDTQEKKAYSEALLACSLPRRMVAACPLAFGEVGVKQRITSVLHYKKPAFWVLAVAVIACVVVAVCFMTNPKQTIDGEVYTYEKAGLHGNFTIALFEDGTFNYTEGSASSYYAAGHWYQNGNYFTLIDDGPGGFGLVNNFLKKDDALIFLAEGSSNFTYVEVQNGERFVYSFDADIPVPKGDWDAVQTVPMPGYAVIGGADEPTDIVVAPTGTHEMIDTLFDTILSSPTEASSLAAYIGEHSEEYEMLLQNKEDTLRYVITEFLNGGQTDLKGSLMRLVLDELAPEAQLRLYAETGQEYFDEWIKGADRMASDHGLEWLEGNQPALYLALQLRSEIYGHSSPVIPTDAPKLPTVTNAEGEKQQAACDALLTDLRTGWWTGENLNPAKEAAAFICFHQHFVGDEVSLYGFGGYFSQDAQGNAADEWSSFTIVTLNASTLQPISVWWPGDGAAHDMSITENFIDYLVEPVIMITPDDYQSLQTALRKQAAKNMVNADAPLPAAHSRIFKRGELELEVSGVRSVRRMNMLAEGVALHEYAVFVCDSDAAITVLNADLSDPAYAEDDLLHPNWGLLYEDDTRVRITDETGTIPITPDLQCVYNLEASLSILDFEIAE